MSLSLRNLNLVQWLQCSLSGIDRPKWEKAQRRPISLRILLCPEAGPKQD